MAQRTASLSAIREVRRRWTRRPTQGPSSLLSAAWRALTAGVMAMLLWPTAVLANESGWAALAKPGAVALIRHATAPGVGDPANFVVEDCATQRNLDERGRAESRRWRDALQARGIAFDAIYSSQWCRCLDTARIIKDGEPTPQPALNSFFADRSRQDTQIAALKTFIAGLPADQRTLLVTHQVVITGLVGVVPASGEMVVVERESGGRFRVVARIPAP